MKTVPFWLLMQLVCCTCCGPVTPAWAGDDGEGDEDAAGHSIPTDELEPTLEFLYNQLQANHDAIRTWVGTYQVVDRFHWDNCPHQPDDATDDNANRDCWSISRAEVQFTLDRESDRIRTDFVEIEPTQFAVEAEASEIVGSADSTRQYRWIRTPEALTEFPASAEREQVPGFPDVEGFGPGRRGRVVYVREPQTAKREQRFGRFIDPREFMSNGTHQYSRTCQLYASALRGERQPEERQHAINNVTIYAHEEGESTTFILAIRYPNAATGEDHRELRTTFSSDFGFQVVSFEKRELGQPYETRTYAYRSQNGVFLPSTYSYDFYERSDDEPAGWRLEKQRTFTLLDSRLNDTVDERLFDTEGLDLQYGDRIADSLSNQLLVFDGESLVPAEGFVYVPRVRIQSAGSEPRPDAPPADWTWLIVINLMVLAVVVVAVLVQRHLRGRSASRT